jgi:hypothetical protein
MPSGSPEARSSFARVPQTPDWKVVPGHAAAIPAGLPVQVRLRN